jgi:glycosyltransferase involved in cell wall biosynthesis
VPIVLGVDGEAKALLESAGAGIAIAPESAEELTAAVIRLRDDVAQARVYGRQGAAFAREHFDRSRLARCYIDVLDTAVSGRRSPGAASPARTQSS